MANISVSPPSVNGTTNNYGGITGLTLVRSTTTSSSEQSGTFYQGGTFGNSNSSGGRAGARGREDNGIITITSYGGTNTGQYGTGGTIPTNDVNGVGAGPWTVSTSTEADVGYFYYQNTTTISYSFTNNTGYSVTIEGTDIANGASSAITPVGQFDITYVIYEEETEEETTTAVVAAVVKPVIPSVYVYGTGATGFGTGLTGYFYPLYTDINASALSAGYHVHTFTEYVGYTFYMPNGAMNHAVSSRPTGTNKFITGVAELDNLEPIIRNPDYATLLPQIKAETDPVKKQALIDQCYQFIVPLTQAEEELFAHINNDYVEDNPNSTDGTPATFISHVGVYYDDIGRTTGTPEAQQLAVVVAEIDETVIATGLIAEYGIGEYGVNEYDG